MGIDVGDRVTRGPDWKWGSQDGWGGYGDYPVGTVLKVGEWVTVEWPDGSENQYRYGADGCYDLKIADGSGEVEVGTSVTRGPSWKWGSQDGWSGSGKLPVGKIIEVHDDQWVRVKWPDGSTNLYRLGAEGAVDLELASDDVDEDEPPSGPPLLVGTKVTRGPDWKWEMQDGWNGVGRKPVGEVTKEAAPGEWAHVKWSNGQTRKYRWGVDKCYDLEIATSATAGLQKNTLVARSALYFPADDSSDGRRPEPSSQDVIEHGKISPHPIGVVVDDVLDGEAVQVRWPAIGREATYTEWGKDGKYILDEVHVGTRVVKADATDGSCVMRIVRYNPDALSVDVFNPASGTEATFRVSALARWYPPVPDLPPGTRVVQGPDCDDGYPSDHPTDEGVVTSEADGWVHVRWPDGSEGRHRWGHDRKYDVCIAVMGRPRIKMGAYVVRGPDWRYGDEDVGFSSGTKLVVGNAIREPDSGWVRVRWPNGLMNNYRAGFEDAHDVLLYAAQLPETRQRPAALANGMYVARGPAWKYKDQDGYDGRTLTTPVGRVVKATGDTVTVQWPNISANQTYRWDDATRTFDLRVVATDAPHVGSTVTRGRDWKWGDQDGYAGAGEYPVGTVIRGIDADGWLRVKWPNGKANSYRWGAEDAAFDLTGVDVVSEEVDADPDHPETLREGSRVTRGPDWKWGTQDGWSGDDDDALPIGRIIEKDVTKGEWAKVEWPNGDKYQYRYGAEDSYDLVIVSRAR